MIRSTDHGLFRSKALPCLLLATLLLAAMACEVPDGPRQVPLARLDVRTPLLGDVQQRTEEVAPSGGRGKGTSSFVRRLRQRRAESADGSGTGDTVSLRRVPIAPGLIGELPRNDVWRLALDRRVVLAVRGAPPAADALIYAEPFSTDSRSRPAMDAHRFQLTVDRELASETMQYGSELLPLAVEAAPIVEMDPSQLLSALEQIRTPTVGRGLGYRSQPNSFTGWRWIGTNRHGTLLRLGRTQGRWGWAFPLTEEVVALIEVLSEESPEIASLLWGEPVDGGAGDPAWMVLGSATRDDGSGAHLAIVCRLRPGCEAVSDLSRFLDSLDTADAALDVDSGVGSASLQGLAVEQGLTMVPDASPIHRLDLRRALRGAVTAARRNRLPPPANDTDAGPSQISTNSSGDLP